MSHNTDAAEPQPSMTRHGSVRELIGKFNDDDENDKPERKMRESLGKLQEAAKVTEMREFFAKKGSAEEEEEEEEEVDGDDKSPQPDADEDEEEIVVAARGRRGLGSQMREGEEEERGVGVAMLRRASNTPSPAMETLQEIIEEPAPFAVDVETTAEEQETEVPRGAGVAMLRRASNTPSPATEMLQEIIEEPAPLVVDSETKAEGAEMASVEEETEVPRGAGVAMLRRASNTPSPATEMLQEIIEEPAPQELPEDAAETQPLSGLQALLSCDSQLHMIKNMTALNSDVPAQAAYDDIDTDSEAEVEAREPSPEPLPEREGLHNLRISEAMLESVFSLFDSDGRGKLDVYDCTSALKSLALTPRALPDTTAFTLEDFKALVQPSNFAADSMAEMQRVMRRHGQSQSMDAGEILKAVGARHVDASEVHDIIKHCSEDHLRIRPQDLRKLR